MHMAREEVRCWHCMCIWALNVAKIGHFSLESGAFLTNHDSMSEMTIRTKHQCLFITVFGVGLEHRHESISSIAWRYLYIVKLIPRKEHEVLFALLPSNMFNLLGV